MKERAIQYLKLIRFDKPVGVLLLLWPTLIALWLATQGRPQGSFVLVFLLGTFLMRSAGCAFNDMADRKYDRLVTRTAQRPLAANKITSCEACVVAVMLALLAFLLVLSLNRLTQMLAIGALFVAATYPYFKRFFALPQAYLGIAFSAGIPMAYAAVLNTVPWPAWVLCLANLCWVIAYDTEYAMVDRPDDLKIGIRTSAITFGTKDVLIIMLCYVLFLSLIAFLARYYGLGWVFTLSWIVAAGCAVFHYRLIRLRDPPQCLKAFQHNQWLGGILFLGIVLDFGMRRLT